MQRLLWFSVRCFLMAVSADPLILILRWISLAVNDFPEGRGGVNTFLLRDGWLMSFDGWLIAGDTWLISVRTRSISGAHREGLQERLTSTLLKWGTFMVLVLNWCRYLKWMYLSLARDAYNAYSSKARRGQGVKKSLKTGIRRRSTSLVIVNLTESLTTPQLKSESPQMILMG